MPKFGIGPIFASLFLFQISFGAKALEVCGLDVAGAGIDRAHIKTCDMIKAGKPGYAINKVKKSGVEYTVSLQRWWVFTLATGTMPTRLFHREIEKEMVMKTKTSDADDASSSIFHGSKVEYMEKVFDRLSKRDERAAKKADHCRELRKQRSGLFL